ncbi:MAG TPA: ECF transporter S component [Clostridiaceae bacterium]|nr:ECF transporter S component [Clostridiaceae bacterium]
MKFNVNKMVKLAMLAALSIILMLCTRFPILPWAKFLEFEFADVPALIGTFLYGPVEGFIITVVMSLVQAFTVSAESGPIGFVMHVIASGTLVLVSGAIYKKVHNFKGAILALIAGSLSMTLIMIPSNLILTTIFLNVPVETVKSMLLPTIIPFNLIKSVGNSAVTVLVYKHVGRILRGSAVEDESIWTT